MTASTHPADRLLEAVSRTGAPVCVGLDPVLERLPAGLSSDGSKADAIRHFSLGVLDAIESSIACIKVQSACFERYGWPGMSALHDVVAAARDKRMVVILDAKRGDIGVTAEHYAAASAEVGADWTTINGYLGSDGIAPFLGQGRGAFVLVRTSNPSGDALQTLALKDGRSVAEAVADLVAAVGAKHVGPAGFSAVGAVVGATKSAEAAALRARMPQQLFLVPGFGAQGAGIDDVLQCFRSDGSGAIVTASRSVIYPTARIGDWKTSIARAAAAFRDEIQAGLGRS
jgi:orotidine-5'-phosphate decarboxylase